MTTGNTGSRRASPDTIQAPAEPSRQDAAEIDHYTLNDPVQPRADKPPSTNLHLPRSPLIGREHEVTAVQRLLLQDEVGLVTVTGPGGIGKTRLALQVASGLLDHFVNGVYFVSLAPVTDPTLVISAIAETLGVREAGTLSLLEALQNHLRHRQMLLVLDNFEQVIPAAPLLAQLISACGRLKLLVTSRATLHLYGEQEFEIPPLALPNPKQLNAKGSDVLSTLRQFASVTLFIQRATAVKPDFALTSGNALTIAQICIALDGLPLAIELAAAKLKLFSPPALLVRLQQRLMLLTDGPQDLPLRQRTLRDEIAWSYDLLAPAEQTLFRRLCIFAGGFTFDSARAVGAAHGDLEIDVLDGIATLVDQNLLKALEPSTALAYREPRFGILETIREYGLEQLTANDEAEQICRRHADFFLALAEAAHLAPNTEMIAKSVVEHDNLRAALVWSLAEAGRAEIAWRLVSALTDFWTGSGHTREGQQWAEAALACTTPADHTEVRASLLVSTAKLALWQGDSATAQIRAEEGMALARQLGAQLLIYDALVYLSFIAHGERDSRLAVARLGEALSIARSLEDKCGIGKTLMFLAGVAYDEHEYEQAQAMYEESLALFREVRRDWNAADALRYLGRVAQAVGHDARAWSLFRESLATWREFGTLRWEGVADCLEGLARIYEAGQQLEPAVHLFAATVALHEFLRGSPSSPSSPPAQEKHARLRAKLGEAAFAAAWAAGVAFSTEEAVDYALVLPAPALSPPATYPAGLTSREVEVLRLLAQGLTYEQIAEQLIISPRTVNRHLTAIYTKLKVTSRHAATRFAFDHHLA